MYLGWHRLRLLSKLATWMFLLSTSVEWVVVTSIVSIVADVTSDNVVGTSQLASMTNLMMSEAEERCEKGVTSEWQSSSTLDVLYDTEIDSRNT